MKDKLITLTGIVGPGKYFYDYSFVDSQGKVGVTTLHRSRQIGDKIKIQERFLKYLG